MNIDVKRRPDGHYFYSFAIEKGTAPQSLLAADDGKVPPTIPNNSLPRIDEFDNTNINENNSSKLSNVDNDNSMIGDKVTANINNLYNAANENEILRSNDSMRQNDRARRIFTQGRLQIRF